MDVAAWQRGLGVERYEPAFRDNGIDADPKLTAEDLKDIGVTRVRDRRKLLEAITALRERALPSRSAKQPSEVGAGRSAIIRGRAGAVDGDVLRYCRLDGAVGAARSRGSARGDRHLSPLRGRCHRARRRVCRGKLGC